LAHEEWKIVSGLKFFLVLNEEAFNMPFYTHFIYWVEFCRREKSMKLLSLFDSFDV